MGKFRVLAGVLAFGGVLWGLFCLLLILPYDSITALLYFGPGYVVTAGYIVRLCSTPPLGWRRAIWGLSALVQGAWLLWYLTELLRGASGPRKPFEWIALAWWSFAFSTSVLGFVAELDAKSV
jgi:hypothetical protein